MKFGLNCHNIPPGTPFLSTLVPWIMQRYGGTPEQLPRLLLLLPNRRACRAAREAFLAYSGGRPLLLPRIAPIGEIAGEEIGWLSAEHAAEMAPAISSLRRQFLLAQLVAQFEARRMDSIHESTDAAQSIELAKELAAFLDEVDRYHLRLEDLDDLVPEELSGHWQQTLSFLHIISKQWPEWLKSEGLMDPVAHRNGLLENVCAGLKQQPPDYPIIAAGSTGSQPATARLLATIARLPDGHVVLPGLDQGMPEEEWALLSPSHPQYGMQNILSVIGCSRQEVRPLVATTDNSEKQDFWRHVFMPAQATSKWRESRVDVARAMQHTRMIEASTTQEEARMIAVALREVLETPGKTAALVTNDRYLARMVSAQMKRFDVQLDDSAGMRLGDTPIGYFMRLTAELFAGHFSPSQLLSVLRHPLAAAGYSTAECRALSRRLETELLRGVRKEKGLHGLHSKQEDVRQLLERLRRQSAMLEDIFAHKAIHAHRILSEHIAFMQWLAGTDEQTGQERLWSGEEGQHMARFLAELMEHIDVLGAIDPLYYPGLLESMLSSQSYWPQFGSHPRLSILSPMEARLQPFAQVILAELNEGSWPENSPADPWMSRPMREQFGLPALEQSIGMSAHDVFQLVVATPEVIMTRARKREGSPAVPSRWWVRLCTFLEGHESELLSAASDTSFYRAALALLDAPHACASPERPAPSPPVSSRPSQMRVTSVDRWLRDPYIIYAEYILKLRELDALDQPLSAADFGTMVHRALEEFVKRYPTTLPEDSRERLLECGMRVFAPHMDRPAVANLWWPRFGHLVGWIVEQETQRRETIEHIYAEVPGKWEIRAWDYSLTLTTRIDRLEQNADGSMCVLDYKTGSLPSEKDIRELHATQLLLEALIVERGEMEVALPKHTVGHIEYWKLGNNEEKSESRRVEMTRELQEKMQTRLEELVARYAQEDQGYEAQSNAGLRPRYNPYAHLIRYAEWEEG